MIKEKSIIINIILNPYNLINFFIKTNFTIDKNVCSFYKGKYYNNVVAAI